jgi:hypothetical protein
MERKEDCLMKMVAFLLASFFLVVPVAPGERDKNLDISLGYRKFGSGVFNAADNHVAMTLKYDFGGKIIRPVVGLGYSSSEVKNNNFAIFQPRDDEADVFELSAGFLVSRFDKALRPYFGAGVAWISVDIELVEPGAVVSYHDSDQGFYLNTGFIRTVGKGHPVNVGMDIRYLTGTEIEIQGRTGDADYFQIGFLVGARFPARAAEPKQDSEE